MTSVTIQIPDRLAQELRARAGSKLDLSAVVLELVEKSLLPAAPSPLDAQSDEEWLGRFHDWVAKRPAYGVVADDSRDSIYAGRGE
jgi:hypothetical protein